MIYKNTRLSNGTQNAFKTPFQTPKLDHSNAPMHPWLQNGPMVYLLIADRPNLKEADNVRDIQSKIGNKIKEHFMTTHPDNAERTSEKAFGLLSTVYDLGKP